MIIGLKPRLLAKARAMLQGIDEAEDMVQEALLRLWTVRGRLGDYRSPEALAITILRNICLTRQARTNAIVLGLPSAPDLTPELAIYRDMMEWMDRPLPTPTTEMLPTPTTEMLPTATAEELQVMSEVGMPLRPVLRWAVAASMKEVVVTATKIKMYWRGDTLVYDATAFKLPDDFVLWLLGRWEAQNEVMHDKMCHNAKQ